MQSLAVKTVHQMDQMSALHLAVMKDRLTAENSAVSLDPYLAEQMVDC